MELTEACRLTSYSQRHQAVGSIQGVSGNSPGDVRTGFFTCNGRSVWKERAPSSQAASLDVIPAANSPPEQQNIWLCASAVSSDRFQRVCKGRGQFKRVCEGRTLLGKSSVQHWISFNHTNKGKANGPYTTKRNMACACIRFDGLVCQRLRERLIETERERERERIQKQRGEG